MDSGNDPEGIKCKNNIVLETGDVGSDHPNKCLVYDSSITATSEIHNNCFYDGDTADVVDYKGADRTMAWLNLNEAEFENNTENADPNFVDADNGDYRLKADSPAFKLGFEKIPVDEIGPYNDELRTSWPIVEAEGAREKPLVSE